MQLDLSKVAVADFETYYDSEYSLRAKELTTSGYIRDERFLAHCVSLKLGEAPAQVYWYDEIAPAIAAIDWSEHYLLAHNTAFDGLILSHHYNVKPKLYLDTMSMARALHSGLSRASLEALCQLYGIPGKNPNILGKMRGVRDIPPGPLRDEAAKYCAGDSDKCFFIFSQMVGVYPEDEIKLVDWTIRQFCDPVLYIDLDRAKSELERQTTRRTATIAAAGLPEEELQSAAKFATQLRALDIEPPMKLSARTKQMTFAFSQQDEEFMDLVTHENEDVRKLIAARLAAKSTIGETRAERFVDIGTAPLPVGLGYAAAHTLRWGGTNKMNLQNLEKEERDDHNQVIPLTGELRKSIIAPPGHMLVVADSRQIEPRVLAYFAGQDDLLDLFRNDGDPYIALASEIYGRIITKADKDERSVGKAGVLGLGYYMGAKRFQATLAMGILGPKIFLTLEECQHIVNVYRAKNKAIVRTWRELDGVLYRMLMKRFAGKMDECTKYKFLEYDGTTIWAPNGMGLHYHDLQAEWNERNDRFEDYSYRSGKEFVRIHPGILIENIIQWLSRHVIAWQLLQIDPTYRVVMMTHDELVCLAKEEEAETCLSFMIEKMSTPPPWAPGLPLGAEGGWDFCYSK